MGAERNFVQRKSLKTESLFKNLFFVPLNGDLNLLEHKAALYRSGAVSRFSQKRVGIIGGSGRTGQAAQAAGSTLLPGNVSAIRSPVRSGVARALTPGGPRRRPRLRKPDINKPYYRCGEGFQFGGRFTDENYSTCGKQLFDIPSLKETLGQALFRTSSKRRPSRVATQGRAVLSSVKPEDDSPQNMQLMIKRAARVTEVGDSNPAGRTEGIKMASQAVLNQDEDSGVLVRRDGFLMFPVVSIEDLRKIEDNKNMEDAAFVKSVRSADQLGSEELGLLSNTGITSLTYVAPNGVEITVSKTKELSTGDRRQLGKDVNSAAEIDVSKNPLARLEFISEKTDGAFEISKDFKDVKNPEDESDAKDSKGLQNWAYEAFVNAPDPKVEEAGDLAEDTEDVAEAAPDATEAASEVAEQATEAVPDADNVPENVAPVAPEERISSLKEAVEHLNNGGLLSAIDPSIVLEALERAENYQASKPRPDITVYTSDENGKVIVKKDNLQFQHLGAHLSSELLRELGVQAPAVRFAGEGDDRTFFYRSPDDVVEDADIDPDFEVTSVPPERIIATQIADWLSDTRDRTSRSLFAATSGDDTDLVVSVGPLAALSGLTQEELEERRNVVLEDFFSSVNDAYGLTFEQADEEQKALVLEIIGRLIDRAKNFSWQDYFSKLATDGVLSDIERTHLDIVKKIYDSRLSALSKSKESLAKIYGVS